MSLRLSAAAVAGCMLAAGCVTMHPPVDKGAAKLDCDGSKACVVTVTVNCLHYKLCDVSVDYDLVFVSSRNNKADIRWQLAGEPGAEFAPNGIVIDSAVFKCGSDADGRKGFVCRNAHPEFGIFKYSVNVTVKDSAFGPRGVRSLDPWVVNY